MSFTVTLKFKTVLTGSWKILKLQNVIIRETNLKL